MLLPAWFNRSFLSHRVSGVTFPYRGAADCSAPYRPTCSLQAHKWIMDFCTFLGVAFNILNINTAADTYLLCEDTPT